MSDVKTANAWDESLSDTLKGAEASFRAATTELELRTELARCVGKNSGLQSLMGLMKSLDPAKRRELGATVNAAKLKVEALFQARLTQIENQALEAELNARPYDLSLPGRVALGRGHEHPVLGVRD